ncbi:HAD family acid phosphatase [Tenacibaculum sp. SG-28]|uniref:HAD family acid phosphatase n=1 Tax=Tenacibaculum sp. SG-28 TaxID=754426 RepID=UPI000CF4131A|nr:HAD family acid phosphatase [Tenacibaculum sp. SG-28]
MKLEKGFKYAVITDIDETVLDNSPYSAMQIKKDVDFNSKDWITWGKLEKAKALPGAVEFFTLADSLGFSVFYISNRSNEQLQETINNLKKWQLPNCDAKHVF